MKAKDFKAYWIWLTSRWPFPEGAEAVAEDYRNDLWVRVKNWRPDYEALFKKAIQELRASDRYSMPATWEITNLAMSYLKAPELTPEEKHRLVVRERFRFDFEEGRWDLRTPSAAIQHQVGCSEEEFRALFRRNFWNFKCPKCGATPAYVAGSARTSDDCMSKSEDVVWSNLDLWNLRCVGCKSLWKERVQEPGMVGAAWNEPAAFDVSERVAALRRGMAVWGTRGRLAVIGILRDVYGEEISAAEEKALLSMPRVKPLMERPIEEHEAEIEDHAARVRRATADYLERKGQA